ncbi:TonB-dependent receptor plug domain-containing protein [bacterium]|nr:TonB-dependent receptor plug domain-containing protein [bacterium]
MRILFIHIACVLAFLASAQTDSTHAVDAVDVVAQRIKTQQIDLNSEILKANATLSMAELLQRQSGIFIRRQGPGTLSTPSYQGLGSMQIPVIIAGQNIQSSMNGTIDLSLIPAFHFDLIDIDHTPSSTVNQSLGSSMEFVQSPQQAGFSWLYSLNQWNRNELGTKIRLQKGKWKYGLSALYAKDPHDNNQFPEKPQGFYLPGNSESISAYQTLQYTSSKQWQYFNKTFILSSHRSIPVFSGPSTIGPRQFDHHLIFTNGFTKYYDSSRIHIQHSFWNERINYDSEESDIHAKHDALNSTLSASYQKQLKAKARIKYYLLQQSIFYSSTNIENDLQIHRVSAGSEYQQKFKYFYLRADVQVQFSEFSPATRSQSVLGLPFKWGYTELQFIQTYRLPVLNELYWYEPGYAFGNLELQPEQGYRIMLPLAWSGKSNNVKVTPFYGRYSNLIEWRQSGVLQPLNVQNVNTSGIELNAQHKIDKELYGFSIQTNWHLVNAVYGEGSRGQSEGKQIIYTPAITGNLNLAAHTEIFGIYTNIQYVGRNYYTSDNSGFLEPYVIFNAGCYAEYKNLRSSIDFNNIGNTDYYSVRNYPLPGRTFKIQINYTIPFKK